MTSDAFRTCRSTGTSCAQCARLGVLVGGDTLPVWPRMQWLTTALISLTGALGVVGGDTLPDLPRGAAGRAASARVRACTCSQRRPPPPHSRRICTGVGTSSASCAHASAHDGAQLPTGVGTSSASCARCATTPRAMRRARRAPARSAWLLSSRVSCSPKMETSLAPACKCSSRRPVPPQVSCAPCASRASSRSRRAAHQSTFGV